MCLHVHYRGKYQMINALSKPLSRFIMRRARIVSFAVLVFLCVAWLYALEKMKILQAAMDWVSSEIKYNMKEWRVYQVKLLPFPTYFCSMFVWYDNVLTHPYNSSLNYLNYEKLFEQYWEAYHSVWKYYLSICQHVTILVNMFEIIL